jgi:hypothetical protein
MIWLADCAPIPFTIVAITDLVSLLFHTFNPWAYSSPLFVVVVVIVVEN